MFCRLIEILFTPISSAGPVEADTGNDIRLSVLEMWLELSAVSSRLMCPSVLETLLCTSVHCQGSGHSGAVSGIVPLLPN